MSRIRPTNQKTFLEVYPKYEDFTSDKTEFSFFAPNDVTDDYYQKTYYLIVSRYGDTPISGYSDEARWRLRFWQVISEYLPEYQVKCEMQKTIRSMTLDEFAEAGKLVNNTALNPNTAPSDSSLDELQYINQQNVARRKLSQADAIQRKLSMLEDGMDDDLLDHFKDLFSVVMLTDVPLHVYQEEDDDDE